MTERMIENRLVKLNGLEEQITALQEQAETVAAVSTFFILRRK